MDHRCRSAVLWFACICVTPELVGALQRKPQPGGAKPRGCGKHMLPELSLCSFWLHVAMQSCSDHGVVRVLRKVARAMTPAVLIAISRILDYKHDRCSAAELTTWRSLSVLFVGSFSSHRHVSSTGSFSTLVAYRMGTVKADDRLLGHRHHS